MNKLYLSTNKISISPLEQSQNNQFQSTTKKTNKNIQYRNNIYDSDFVKFENLRNLSKDEFIYDSVKSNNSSFKGSDAYKFKMWNLETGLTKQKEKSAQTFLVPFFEAVKKLGMSKPSLISFKGSEQQVAEISLLDRLNNAQSREDFVAIRDEIKEMPYGKERKVLFEAYLKAYSEWSKAPQRADIRMEYKPDEVQFKELTDDEFKAMKPQVEAELEVLFNQDHQYINLLRSKLILLNLNKYNIQLVDKFIKTPELNNSKNVIKYIDGVINTIKSEHQAKVGKVILENPELFNNINFADKANVIIMDSYSKERAEVKINIMNYIKQNPEFMNNKNFMDKVGVIIYNSNTKERATVIINMMKTIKENCSEWLDLKSAKYNKNFVDNIGDIIDSSNTQGRVELITNTINFIKENCFEWWNPKSRKYNKNFADKVGDIILSSNTQESANVKIDLMNYIKQNYKLMKNKKLVDKIGDIIYNSYTKESAEIAKYICENSRLMNNKNFADNIGIIIDSSKTKESAEVAKYICDNPEFINSKTFVDKLDKIIYSSYTKERVLIIINMMKALKENCSEWLDPKSSQYNQCFVDIVGDIVLRSNTSEHVEVMTNMMKSIKESCSEWLEPKSPKYNKNFADRVGDIILRSNTNECTEARIAVMNYIKQNPELMNNKNFTDKVGDIIFNSFTKKSIEVVKYICDNSELMNNKNFADKVGDIIFNSFSTESIKVAKYICDNSELMNNKNFADKVGDIIFNSFTKEGSDTRINVMNYIKQHQELMDNKSFADKFGDIIFNVSTNDRVEVAKYICDHSELMNNKNFADKVGDIIFSSQIKEQAEAKMKFMDCINANPQLLKNQFFKENVGEIVCHINNINNSTKDAIESIINMYDNMKQKRNILKIATKDLTDEDIIRSLVNHLDEFIEMKKFIGETGFEAAFTLKVDGLVELAKNSYDVLSNMPKENKDLLILNLNPKNSSVLKEKITNLNNEINELKKQFPQAKVQGKDVLNNLISQINTKTAELNEANAKLNDVLSPQDVVSKFRAVIAIGGDVELINLIRSNVPTTEEIKEAKQNPEIMEQFNSRTNKKIDFNTWLKDNVIKQRNEHTWNEAINKKVFSSLGLEYDEKVATTLNIHSSKYLSEILSAKEEFKENFKDIVELIKNNPDKNLKDILNELPQNKETKLQFEQMGLDYDKWISFDENSYKEIQVELNAEEAKQNAIKNLEEDFNTPSFTNLPPEEQAKIKELLKKNDVELRTIEEVQYNGNGLIIGTYKVQRLYKDNNPIMFEDLPHLISELKKAINNNEFYYKTQGDNIIDDARTTFRNHISQLRNSEISTAKSLKNNETANLEIRKTDMMDLKNSLFLGNQASCCTAVGTGCNQFSAPTYIKNRMISAIEVVDGENLVGNTMIYIAEIDGKPALMLDNIEMNPKYQYNDKIRDAFFDYAKQITEEIGRPDLPIYAGPYRHKFDMKHLEYEKHYIKIKGSTGEDEIYIDYVAERYVVGGIKVDKVHLYKIR